MSVPSYRDILNLSSKPLNEGTKMDIMLSVQDAAASGLALYHDHKNKLNPRVGPLTAIPAPWPRKSLAVANYVSSLMSILLGLVSQDKKWIFECLKDGGVLEDDEFTKELVNIMMETTNKSPLELTLFRHDFMLHVPNNSQPILDPKYGHLPIKNVEMNTMSVALSYLSDKIQAIHNRTLNRLIHCGHWPNVDMEKNRLKGSGCETFTSSISSTLREYNQIRSSISRPQIRVSLMVTEDYETNSIDQLGMWRCADGEFCTIPIMRTLSYLLTSFKEGNLYKDENDNLILKELNRDSEAVEKEISLVYWRVFYHPRHTDGPHKNDLMKLRKFIEATAAIKLPTLASQLAGTKEIQKRLVSRTLVERYLTVDVFNGDKVVQQRSIDLLISCMARQTDPLDDIKLFNEVLTIEERKKWVLKPQLEGGGNNLFDDAMVDKLKILKETKIPGQTGYVLMELIRPPSHNATVLDIDTDACSLKTFDADSELGVYSAAVFFNRNGDGGREPNIIKLNESLIGLDDKLKIPNIFQMRTGGTVLRTKPKDVKEGGIHAGFGWMDSPFLIDDFEWMD